MLSFIDPFRMVFRDYVRETIQAPLENPGRGWYRIYTYHIGCGNLEEPVRYAGESLALLLLDIGAYRDQDLDQEALRDMQWIISRFVDLGFELILRICYDTEGKGMVREPSLFSQVKNHLSQIAPLLLEFSEHIFVYQGLLVGNWGEMHESKFLSQKCLQKMVSLFLRETRGKLRLALRKPMQGRMAFSEQQMEAGEAKRLGFFNDGIFGSLTHLGTFAPDTTGKGAWQEMWGTKEELSFMKPFLDQVPFGGEVLYPTEKVTLDYLESGLKGLRVSYLNCIHDERMLSDWKKLTYVDHEDGKEENYYEHVGMRLGYCFQVRRVEIKFGKKWECFVWVEDIGYGSLYDESEAILWLESSESDEQPLALGIFEGTLCGMACGETRRLGVRFERPENIVPEKDKGISLSISLRRKRDQREILFAQKSQNGRLLLGEVFKR